MLFLHPPFTIHHYESLGSTNDQLKSMSEAPEFTCLSAAQQTAGRGRRDRSWHSAPSEGLYLSVLLRPNIIANRIPLLSLLAAVAVAEAVEIQARISDGTNLKLDIKWPNDVLLNERKLGGILIESTTVPNEPPRVILGIGINVNHQFFPPELHDIATSLALATGQHFSLTDLRNRLLDRLAEWYEILRAHRDHKILQRWQELSSYADGKFVIVDFDDKKIEGRTAGLNPFGALKIILPSGEIHTILAGEIRHLRTQK